MTAYGDGMLARRVVDLEGLHADSATVTQCKPRTLTWSIALQSGDPIAYFDLSTRSMPHIFQLALN